MKRAPRAPEPKEFANLKDYVGDVVAIKGISRKQQLTDYGETTAYVVNVALLDGTVETGLLCFWRDVQKQLDQAHGDWIAGLLRKERAGKYERYLLDSSKVSDDELARLQEITAAAASNSGEEEDDIPF